MNKEMAMKVVSVKSEKTIDTNPNIYLQRAEQYLENGRYDEALEEARLAVKYSNNNQRVLEQYNKIKNALNGNYTSETYSNGDKYLGF